MTREVNDARGKLGKRRKGSQACSLGVSHTLETSLRATIVQFLAFILLAVVWLLFVLPKVCQLETWPLILEKTLGGGTFKRWGPVEDPGIIQA